MNFLRILQFSLLTLCVSQIAYSQGPNMFSGNFLDIPASDTNNLCSFKFKKDDLVNILKGAVQDEFQTFVDQMKQGYFASRESRLNGKRGYKLDYKFGNAARLPGDQNPLWGHNWKDYTDTRHPIRLTRSGLLRDPKTSGQWEGRMLNMAFMHGLDNAKKCLNGHIGRLKIPTIRGGNDVVAKELETIFKKAAKPGGSNPSATFGQLVSMCSVKDMLATKDGSVRLPGFCRKPASNMTNEERRYRVAACQYAAGSQSVLASVKYFLSMWMFQWAYNRYELYFNWENALSVLLLNYMPSIGAGLIAKCALKATKCKDNKCKFFRGIFEECGVKKFNSKYLSMFPHDLRRQRDLAFIGAACGP